MLIYNSSKLDSNYLTGKNNESSKSNGGKRSFVNTNDNRNQNPPKQQTKNNDARYIDVANKFISDITAYRNDVRNIKLIVADSIDEISKIILNSTKPNMTDIGNRLIAVMVTGQIPKAICDMIENGELDRTDERTVERLSFMISKILQGSASLNMSDDKISMFVDAFGTINRELISEITSTCSMASKELVLDLLISYPVLPDALARIGVANSYDKFIIRILDYADDIKANVSVDEICKLYKLLFGSDISTRYKVCVSIIGQYLAHPPLNIDDNDSVKMEIYKVFVKSLYTILNGYADKSIGDALNIVQNAVNNGIDTLFNVDDAKLFDNVIAVWNKRR